MSKVNLGTLPSTQNTFSVLLDSVCAVKASITNCNKSQIATMVSQFVTVAICDGSKHNFSDRFHSNRGYSPKCINHVHIKIGPFQEGFLGTLIMGFITDIHTHKQIYQWNNTKMGKNTTFHIHVKSEPGYFPKYPEHVFSVIGLSLCRQGIDHKLRQSQIATLPSQFVICRNLWSKPWRHKLSPIILKTCSGYLGEYLGSLLTWIWKVSFLPNLALFQCYIWLCVCISVIKPIIDLQRKPFWWCPTSMCTCFLHWWVNPLALRTWIWEVAFWTVTKCDSHKLRQFRNPCRRILWFGAFCDHGRYGTNWVQ